MIYEKRYKNGLRLIVKQMQGLLSVTAGILVGTGSAYETDAEDGISHFIEHMQFKGTKTRSAFALSDAFDRIGAQVNAFTGKDLTCYYVKSTSDHTEEALRLLSDMFLNATFPDEEMEREKGVVLEEISMNEDTPDELCFDVLAEALYGRENYGRNILGPKENVSGFTREAILAYKKARYCPENIVISFAGGLDFKTVEKLVDELFADIPVGAFEKREKKVEFAYKSLVKQKSVEQMHLAIGYPALDREHPLMDALQTLNAVLGGGMSSRLFQEVREKQGLAYSVYSYTSAFEECGSLIVYAGVSPSNADKAYASIEKCIAEILKDGLTQDEFLRGREQMKSSLLFAQESTSAQMLMYGKYMMYNNAVLNLDEKLEDINKVTLDDVMKAAELVFSSGKKAIGVIGNTNRPLPL